MPKRVSGKTSTTPKKKGKPRIAPNGNRLPDPLPSGEVLTDVMKCKWKLGKSIGLGGFGEIYLASDDIKKPPSLDAKYVVKIEPHTNGPLFAEMHFYHRVGKANQIKEWMRRKKLSFLGMPKFIGSGSHEYKGVKYRFMVLERFGKDLQKLLEMNNRIFPIKTVYTLGINILNILEYIHSHGYIHADVKASNLVSGFGKGKQNQVHLVDYGLACKYISNGQHKEFKEDLRKAHDGTIEFTSRDAHIGAHSRRGDLEILGYNMLQWLCGRLPWENNLKDPEYVSTQKNLYMADIPKMMKDCFPSSSPPQGIAEFITYVADLKFEEEPDYEHCSNILASAIKACGFKHDGKVLYTTQGGSTPLLSKKNLKRPAKENVISPPPNKIRKIVQKMPSESAGAASPRRKIRRVASAAPGLQSAKSKDSPVDNYISSFDNPTPAMLLVMQRKLQMLQQQQQQQALERAKSKISLDKNGNCLIPKDKVKETEVIFPATKKGPLITKIKGPAVKTKKRAVASKIKLRIRHSCSVEL